MSKKSGFTLVELAIVIVIIGLLVGGVLQGQELIQQAKVRSLSAKLKSYDAAIVLFKDKYNCLPGDCSTARIQSFLGNLVTGGNNDNNITRINTTGASESLGFWQHLSVAKLIKGSFTGNAVSLPLKLDQDVPSCEFEGCGIVARYTTNFTNSVIYQNFFELGKVDSTLAHFAAFNVQTAYSVDQKIDDGVANRGNIIAVDGGSVTGCSADYASNGGADYQFSTSGIVCRLFMKSNIW